MATPEKRKPVLPKPGLFDEIGALECWEVERKELWTLPKAPCGRDKRLGDGKGFAAGSQDDIASDSGGAAGANFSRYRKEVEWTAPVRRRLIDVPF